MLNKSKINAFWDARTRISDPRIATNYRDDGRLAFDLDLVLKHISGQSTVLDLGAGTCTLAVELVPKAKRVVAVEKFEEFLEAAPDLEGLEKICCDVVEFESEYCFDTVLLFGVVNFLTQQEERKIYERVKRLLAADGKFIVKHQCGVANEVVIDHYSPELNAQYHARYPYVADCEAILRKYFRVEVVDIYPKGLNRWENTHFFAFVCE